MRCRNLPGFSRKSPCVSHYASETTSPLFPDRLNKCWAFHFGIPLPRRDASARLSGPAPLGRRLIPKFETTLEGVRVVAQSRFWRQASKLLGIAAAQHDVIGLQCRDEMLDDVGNLSPPLFLAKALEAFGSHTILESLAL